MWSFVFSLLCVCALTLTPTDPTDPLRDVFTKQHTLEGGVLLIICFFAFLRLPAVTRRMRIGFLLLGAFVAFWWIAGESFRLVGDLSLWFGDIGWFCVTTLRFVGFWALLYGLFAWATAAIDHVKPRSVLPDAQNAPHQSRHPIARVMLILLFCWLPYIIIFYPGVGNYDTCTQIFNIFGKNDLFYNYLAAYLKDTGSALHDHHPIFTTLLLMVCVKTGLALGSFSFGLFLHTIIQLTFAAYVFAVFCRSAERWGIPFARKFVWIFAFVPLFPLVSILSIKNALHGLVVLWFCTLLVDVMRTRPNYQLPIAALLLTFTHKGGVFVALFGLIPLLVVQIKKRNFTSARCSLFSVLCTLAAILLPIALLCVKNALLPVFHISPGDPKEMYSVFFQQTGRVVRDHGDDLPQDELDVLNRVFYVKRLAKRYDPVWADGVKDYCYRAKTVTKADIDAYFVVWQKQFFRYPGTCIQATLHNVYSYFIPSNTEQWTYSIHGGYGFLARLEGGKYALNETNDALQKSIADVFNLPGLGVLFRGQIWILLLLLSCVTALCAPRTRGVKGRLASPCGATGETRRQTARLADRKIPLWALLPLIAHLGLCLLSPVNGNLRYMFPFVLSSPLILASFFLNGGTHEQQDKTV